MGKAGALAVLADELAILYLSVFEIIHRNNIVVVEIGKVSTIKSIFLVSNISTISAVLLLIISNLIPGYNFLKSD